MIGLSLLGFLTLRSSRFAWFVYVLAMGSSGLEISMGAFQVLPEHVIMPIIAWHVMKSQTLNMGRLIPLNIISLRVSFLLIVTWLVISTLLSVAYAPNAQQSLKMILWVTINFAMLSVVGLWKVKRQRVVIDGLIAASIIAAFSLVTWVYSNITGNESTFVETDYASDTLRAAGLMLEPNLLASYCALWVCVAFINRRYIPNWIVGVSTTLLTLVILATYTRAAMLVVGIVAITWLLRRKNIVVITFISLLFVFCMLLSELVFSSQSRESSSILGAILMRLENILELDSGTGAFRIVSWDLAWTEIQATGFLHGHGFNSFPQTHFSEITSSGELYLGFLWLALWYDAGLLPALCFIVAFILFWIKSDKSSWVYFVAFIAVSITTNPLWYAYPWILAALVLKTAGPINIRARESTSFEGLPHGKSRI